MKRLIDDLERRLAEAEETIRVLRSAPIDAVADIASQKALRESEERYRQIVESTTEGIVKVDAEAVIVFSNRRFAEMIGYDPTELLGRSFFSFMDADSERISREGRERRKRGVKDSIDLTFRHKDGREIAVSLSGAPIFDGENRYIGALALARDVTEQKRLMAQLMVSDRMASVGTLAAGVAHEINNPLAVVVSNLAYAVGALGAAGASTEELKEPLADALEAAERVRRIVLDLRLFSRSRNEESLEPVDVRTAIESTLRMAWNEIRHRARLIKDCHDVPRVMANEARLGQVFLNLIVNAAQSLPEGRSEQNEICITTRHVGDRVVVAVRDTGTGIPPENLGRIFDAFFTTKTVGVGTGLGLAISHRIVTSLGGDLTVQSKVGEGTTFQVSLPIAPAEQMTAPATTPAPARFTRRLRGRILIVDDEEQILRSVDRLLSREHDIVTAITAQDVLHRCGRGEKFDVILCDVVMPVLTGIDLHRELMRLAPDQAERMIFFTGGAVSDATREFLAQADVEHFDKPFDVDALRAILQRRLEALHSAAPGRSAD